MKKLLNVGDIIISKNPFCMNRHVVRFESCLVLNLEKFCIFAKTFELKIYG